MINDRNVTSKSHLSFCKSATILVLVMHSTLRITSIDIEKIKKKRIMILNLMEVFYGSVNDTLIKVTVFPVYSEVIELILKFLKFVFIYRNLF